jgi:hypothetical protein
MSQLIALIIAIALGAIVTAIGYVFLGDAFTSNSERGVALQFVNQASQMEMAMTAFRASEAGSAFSTDFTTTLTTGDLTDGLGLVDEGFLKDIIVAPQGDYVLLQDGTNGPVYLVSQSADLTAAVCASIEDLVDGDDTVTAQAFTAPAAPAEITTALGTNRYGCFTDSTTPGSLFAYEVE